MLVESRRRAQAPDSIDEAFTAAGATVVDGPQALYRDADVLLKVRRPLVAGEGELDEMALLRAGQVLIGMLDPYQNPRAGRRPMPRPA